jgi:hypothetical protein
LLSKFSRARARISGRYALAIAAVVVVGLPAGALASGEGRSLISGSRNPAHGSLTRETQVIASNGTYGTRQSNKGSGGGAIYGCRAATGNEPCIRSNNLKAGRAFEFSTRGKEAGQIEVKDTTGVPFTTNATGKVGNLNADKLDDKDSADFAAAGDLLFAAVNADGSLVSGSRGATASAKSNPAGQTYTVTFGRDVSKCSYSATAVGGSTTFGFGVSPTAGNANAVDVDEADDAGTPAGTGRAFHLQVIC